MTSKEPKDFRELCEQVGLALMMGQKVQFSLAYYYSVYHINNSGWSEKQAKLKIDYHLSKPMGFVVTSIKKDGIMKMKLFEDVLKFKQLRNWLAHDFDQESTPFLTKDERFEYYISKMKQISEIANTIMNNLDQEGEKLTPVNIYQTQILS